MLHSQSKITPASFLPQTGKKIKNYVYNYSEQIGRGNFAKVYRGINTKTNEAVAIKIISLDQLKCKRLEELVFEQIKILQYLNHPNILKFYEALLSDRNCYIITELCNQGDLDDRIKKRKPLSEGEFNKVILDVYQGLKYLKQMGVTHRDLKPANIFMHNGQAKIADFGLAKFYKDNFKDLDIGSPPYMSPEGLIHNIYGEKTDIWAFGIVIYELLHGESPFACYKLNQDLFAAVTVAIPQNKFRKNIPPQLRNLMNSLLEVYIAKRPSIQELAKDPFINSLLFPKEQNAYFTNKKFMLGQTVPQQNNSPIKVNSMQQIQQQPQSPNARRQNKIQIKVGPETPKYLGFIGMNKSQQIFPGYNDRSDRRGSLPEEKFASSSTYNQVNKIQIELKQKGPGKFPQTSPELPSFSPQTPVNKTGPFLLQNEQNHTKYIQQQNNYVNANVYANQMSAQPNELFYAVDRQKHRQLSEKTTETNQSEDDKFLIDYFKSRNPAANSNQFKKI